LAFDQRQVQDYGEYSLATADMAEETLKDAGALLDAILFYVRSSIYPELEL
jgi:hypothetical protein